MTQRNYLINKCVEFRKMARPLIPWAKTCEQSADEQLAAQKGNGVVQAGTGSLIFGESGWKGFYERNKTLVLVGSAIVVIMILSK